MTALLVVSILIVFLLTDTPETNDKCSDCLGHGGFIHPDGLSAHTCEKCKGSGKNLK